MNDELQNQLAAALQATIEAAGTAKDFLAAELPDVVQQLLLWKMAHSIVISLIGIVVFIIVPWLIFRGYRRSSQYDALPDESSYRFDKSDFMTLRILLQIVFGLLSFIPINFTWLQIWLAPKVYLIEYAARLAGGSCG